MVRIGHQTAANSRVCRKTLLKELVRVYTETPFDLEIVAIWNTGNNNQLRTLQEHLSLQETPTV